jgi:hypothetical protein
MALWVENEARRANRNLLLVNGGILAIIILVVAGNYRYCANFVLGCQSISSAELAALTSPEQRWRNFVSVSGTKSVNTEYRDVVNHMEGSRVVSTEIKDEYIFLRVGEKILLVKADPGKEKLEYSGELVPTTEQVRSDLLGPLATEDADLAREVLPFTAQRSRLSQQWLYHAHDRTAAACAGAVELPEGDATHIGDSAFSRVEAPCRVWQC